MKKEEEIFFRLIRIAIGTEERTLEPLTENEWFKIVGISLRQALGGIIMTGVELLPQESRPPKMVLLQMIGWANRIEDVNRRLNNEAVRVMKFFNDKGFRAMILKGQGVSELYPRPLRRIAGDIDIWLDGSRKDITQAVKAADSWATSVYHHIDSKKLSKEFEVEVHFTPSWMNNPLTNRKLQRMFRHWADEGFGMDIPLTALGASARVPTPEMNRIYILVHIYRHLLNEGIGMKQMLDYFFVFQTEMNDEERRLYKAQVRSLRMYRFARAVMYVLGRVFGMPERQMPVPPSEKYGKRLLEEILLAGNFGQYDSRMDRKKMDTEWGRFFQRTKRVLRFAADYPQEVLWTPYFKIWHYFWRRLKNRGLKQRRKAWDKMMSDRKKKHEKKEVHSNRGA